MNITIFGHFSRRVLIKHVAFSLPMAAGVDTVHAACAFSYVDIPAKADAVATVEIHAFRLLCQIPVIIDIISTYIPRILWNNGDAHL
jgi:hypothetical protein